ncbi:6-phospho-beta-glucosidase OS=Streptomyces tendae OX=1932 GN=F3L20_26725 PE=3 SV=1 [Streptomyces tendae]
MKLTVVGGGSTYTPELIDGFARLRDVLPVTELVLTDPATDRLDLIGPLSRRIFDRLGHPGRITTTTDLDAAVDGADAVLLQLRVGGQALRASRTSTRPLDCGCVGQETTGAGGLAKALRTVPVVLDIADRVRRSNPDAWIIDFTGTVGIVNPRPAPGRPQGAGPVQRGDRPPAQVRGPAERDAQDVALDHVGLNHLTWETAVHVGGENVLPRLLTEHGETIAADLRLPLPLLTTLAWSPSTTSATSTRTTRWSANSGPSPPERPKSPAWNRNCDPRPCHPALAEKPPLLAKRGGAYYSEAAVDLAAALLRNAGSPHQVVNTRNNGAAPLPPGRRLAEVPARITPKGAEPLPVSPMDPLFSGLVRRRHRVRGPGPGGGPARRPGPRVRALPPTPLIGQYEYATARPTP